VTALVTLAVLLQLLAATPGELSAVLLLFAVAVVVILIIDDDDLPGPRLCRISAS